MCVPIPRSNLATHMIYFLFSLFVDALTIRDLKKALPPAGTPPLRPSVSIT